MSTSLQLSAAKGARRVRPASAQRGAHSASAYSRQASIKLWATDSLAFIESKRLRACGGLNVLL